MAVWNGSAWVYQAVANAQVSASAAIAYSKLNLSGSVVNADVATGAAIAYAKLNIAAAVKDSDIASAQNLSKLSGVTGTPTGSKFLRDDGTWNLPAGLTTYRKSAATAVNNTIVATDLLAGSMSAIAALTTTNVIQFEAEGDFLQNASVGVALPRLQLVFGGTTLIDTNVPTTAVGQSATRYAWRVKATIRNLGATNSQQVFFEMVGTAKTGGTANQVAFTTGTGIYHTLVWAATDWEYIARGYNTAAVDTSATKALVLNVINGTASVNYETKLFGAHATVI